MKPVWETRTREVHYTVMKAVYETYEQEICRTVLRPVKCTKTVQICSGRWETRTTVKQSCCGKKHGAAQRILSQHRVWVPEVLEKQVECVRYVPEVQTIRVPYTVRRLVPEHHVKTIAYQVCRMVYETRIKNHTYQVSRLIPEQHVKTVTYQVCRMVPEQRVRIHTYQVSRMVPEHRVKMAAQPDHCLEPSPCASDMNPVCSESDRQLVY